MLIFNQARLYITMVFFTSILIVTILYFFQADGLLYVTVIALVAELINIFLTHTLTKSVEQKLTARHRRSVQGYLARIKANKKTIMDLEKIQEDAANKIYKANSRIKELELELAGRPEGAVPPASENPAPDTPPQKVPAPEKEPPPSAPKAHEDHLPDGSRR